MKIDGIVISCYRFDLELTRICVASIRFWYPHVPIWLLKDLQYGDFNTTEIEAYWNVGIYPSGRKRLGWGFGKLLVMTELPPRRFLFLDSDTVFAGRVLDRLLGFDEDIVVEDRDYVAMHKVEDEFFSLDRIRQLDPAFRFPGFGFNTGQFLATTAIVTKADFEDFLDWQGQAVRQPHIFQCGEQGLLNYVVLRKMLRGELTIRRDPLMVWPGASGQARHIQVADFTPAGPHQQVIHWAGLRWGKTPQEMPRTDILLHFQRIYYSKVPLGAWLPKWRWFRFRVQRGFITPLKDLAKQLLSKLP